MGGGWASRVEERTINRLRLSFYATRAPCHAPACCWCLFCRSTRTVELSFLVELHEPGALYSDYSQYPCLEVQLTRRYGCWPGKARQIVLWQGSCEPEADTRQRLQDVLQIETDPSEDVLKEAAEKELAMQIMKHDPMENGLGQALEEDKQARAALELAERNAPLSCRRMHMFAAHLFATNEGWKGGSFDSESDDDMLRVMCKDEFREWLYAATAFFMRGNVTAGFWRSPEFPSRAEAGAATPTGELQVAVEQI